MAWAVVQGRNFSKRIHVNMQAGEVWVSGFKRHGVHADDAFRRVYMGGKEGGDVIIFELKRSPGDRFMPNRAANREITTNHAVFSNKTVKETANEFKGRLVTIEDGPGVFKEYEVWSTKSKTHQLDSDWDQAIKDVPEHILRSAARRALQQYSIPEDDFPPIPTSSK
jgi:hypothetical protein